MKPREDAKYSITAYAINFKERIRFFGDSNKDNCIDKTEYITNPVKFVTDFLEYIEGINRNERTSYLRINKKIPISQENILGTELFVNYGRSGQDFLTVEPNGTEQSFGEDTKIVKYYKVFFLVRNDNNVFFVIFRNGVNSCKTAFQEEMKKFLDGTNVILELPYVSNNQYIDSLFDNISLVSLNFDTLYGARTHDNIDDPKIFSKRYSTTSIDLSLESNVHRYCGKLRDWFRGISSKELISTALKAEIKDSENYFLDENSLSVVISFNGFKRTVAIREIAQLYDVDITSKLSYGTDRKPTDASIIREIVEYIGGIKLQGENNE